MTNQGPFSWEGGWNTKASAITLPQNQYSDASNVQILYGDLYKRKGSAALNSSAFASSAVVHGLADWQTAAGQRYLVLTAGTAIGQTADLGGTITTITGAVTITSGQNNQSTFASLNNLLVRCGGATPDAPIKWSGTGNAAALGGSPPSGNICTTVNNFMFISGIAANPSRVFWSNVSDPETWGASNYVDYRLSDGDRVIALAPQFQKVVIFKRRTIGLLETNPPSTSASVTLGPLITQINGIGCVGSLALDSLPDGRIAFVAPNAHVYIFDGVGLEDISDPEPPKSNIQPTLDTLPVGRLPYAVLRVYPTRNQIWISVSTGSGTTNSTVYVYDYMLKAWMAPFTNIAANVMVASLDTRAVPSHPIVMLTGNYAGKVYEQDKGNTNAEVTGTTIDGYATKSIQLGADKREFFPRSVLVPMESQGAFNLEVNYGYDGLTETTNQAIVNMNGTGGILDQFILDVSVLGGPNYLRRIALLASKAGSASSVQIQLRNRQSAQDFTVHPIVVSDEIIV